MEQTLYTRKELAERWGISTSTLDRRIREGIIAPTNDTGQPRYHIDDILRAEGTDNSKMSPFERRRLEREIQSLKEERDKLLDEKEETKRWLLNMVTGIMPKLQD